MSPPTLVNLIPLPAVQQGELMMITKDYTIYHLPCGDLCASTCLDQAEDLPTYEVMQTRRFCAQRQRSLLRGANVYNGNGGRKPQVSYGRVPSVCVIIACGAGGLLLGPV